MLDITLGERHFSCVRAGLERNDGAEAASESEHETRQQLEGNRIREVKDP
jgi:hypothetical protein